MNQPCSRRERKKRREFAVMVWKMILLFMVGVYFTRYGFMGSPIFYGSMENYMQLAMKWKYHVNFHVDSVRRDNYFLFFHGGYQGELVDEEGYWYKCYYYQGKLYDNYSITVALKQELYDTLNQAFEPMQEILAAEYDANFFVSQKNWLIGKASLRQGIKKDLINVIIALYLNEENIEILIKECQKVYQMAEKFPFQYTIKVWAGKHPICSLYSDSHVRVTEERIRNSIVNGLKRESKRSTYRHNWEGGFQR